MTNESNFTFTTPLNVNIVEIKGEEHLFVEGDISTNDIDLVNDIMTENCQKSMQKQIMERNMKLDLEHEAFKGDTHEQKEISKTKIPAGKIIDATVKDLGKGRYSTSVKGEINRHNPNYKSIKGNLVDKYLDAFSVAFLATDVTHTQKEGKNVRLLNDVKLLNVALTGNPCNTSAQLANIFTKSMDAVEEYKRLKEADPTIEGMLEVKNTSNSTDHKEGNQLNNQKISKKMTDENQPDVKSIDANEQLKSMSEELKSVKETYEAVIKENTEVKESVSKIAETLKEVVEALKKPVHKSPGVQPTDAKIKAKPEAKSVDPLELCM